MVNCCGLTDHRQITSGTDRNVVAHYLISQIFGVTFFQSQSVVLFIFIPVFQADDQIDRLRIFYGRCTEQSLDIHDADTTQFNEVLCDIRCGTHQRIIADLAEFYHIIGYQTMSSLDQLQSRLGLTDAALAGDQDTLAVDIHQYAVYGDTGSQLDIQPADDL